MDDAHASTEPGRRRRRALFRYAVGWLGPTCLVVVIFLLLPHGEDAPLPPVRQIQLERAARTAQCELRIARAGAHLIPPVDGAAAVPARPGVYHKSLPASALVAALRRGIVVIRYRPGVDETTLAQLRAVQAAVPQGTIVVPDETMPFEVAATAWRRLLGCRRFDNSGIDALRLFRGRFIGSGPDQ